MDERQALIDSVIAFAEQTGRQLPAASATAVLYFLAAALVAGDEAMLADVCQAFDQEARARRNAPRN